MKKTLSLAIIAVMSCSMLLQGAQAKDIAPLPTKITDIKNNPVIQDTSVIANFRMLFDGYIVGGDYEILQSAWPRFFTVDRLSTRYDNRDEMNWYLIHTDGTQSSAVVDGRTRMLNKYDIYEVRQRGNIIVSNIFTTLAAPSALVPKGYKKLYANTRNGNFGYYTDKNILLTKVSNIAYTGSAITRVIPASYFEPKYTVSVKNGERVFTITPRLTTFTFTWNPNIRTSEYLAAVSDSDKYLTFYLIPNKPGYTSLAQAQSALQRGDFTRFRWRVVAVGKNGIVIGQIPGGVGAEQLRYALWNVITPTFVVK